jgi:polyprenyl-phospho-N-acetylgalactosaminyl synthase
VADVSSESTAETDGLYVIVAAYGEETLIGPTVAGLRRHFRNVVVVDDGSTDRTAERGLLAGAVVLRHPVNLGQGAALQTGIDYALSQGAAFIATFDADGQHRPEDLSLMLETLVNERCDIVLGSRFLGRTEGMPASRALLLKAAVAFTRATTGLALTDAHNGLRLLTAESARRIRIRQNRMAHASEILDEVARLRLRHREVPVTIAYSEYSLRKGQRLSGSVNVVVDLVVGWMLR